MYKEAVVKVEKQLQKTDPKKLGLKEFYHFKINNNNKK